MKKHILTAAFAAVTAITPAAAQSPAAPLPGVTAAAETNSDDAAGYMARGLMMESTANYRGAVDQLSHALKLYPSAADRETIMLHLASASAHIPGADARTLYRRFLDEYPASLHRQNALMGLADTYFDAASWGEALMAYNRVDAAALDDSAAETLQYRRAYCMLKTGSYDKAARIYSILASTKKYGSAARFYQGYIAYAKGDRKEAARLFGEVAGIRTAPCDAAPYYLAQIAFADKDYKKAAREGKRLLDNPGVSPEYRSETERIVGESLYFTGHEKEGVAYLSRYVAEAEAPLPSATYLLGVEEYRAGRYAKAIEWLTPASGELSALGQSACLYIGQSYLQQGNYDAASMALQKACRMDFDDATREMAYYDYAVAHLQGGRTPFGSSVALFEDFLQRYPSSSMAPQVQDYVVSGYVNDNNYEAALVALDQIARPTDNQRRARQQVLYLSGTRMMQSGDTRGAIRRLSEAQNYRSLDPALGAETDLWLGECHYRTGDYNKADELFTSYLRSGHAKGSNLPLARYDRGYTRFAMKLFAPAKADFNKYLSLASASAPAAQRADALNRVADCEYYARDFAAAAATYARAYDAAPAQGDYPIYQQAMMKGLQGDNDAKIDLLDKMRRQFPQSALTASSLLETAESYAATGRHERALEGYTAVAERFPSTEQGRRGLLLSAITYLNLGKTARAKECYKKVISRYPSSEEARAAADDLKHIAADEGSLADYTAFLASVPDAPKLSEGEAAALMLESAQKAADEGRTADAIARAAEIADNYPDSPESVKALAIKAQAEADSGMTPRAFDTYVLMAGKASSAADINTARQGIMNLGVLLGRYDSAIEAADGLLSSSAVGADVQAQAQYTKALALSRQGNTAEAMRLWSALATDPESLYGAMSLYQLAQTQFDSRRTAEAETSVNRLIDANPPHDYWLARGFILLSDICAAKGNTFEAGEYLRSLRENYPGTEEDIFRMIDSRLEKLK